MGLEIWRGKRGFEVCFFFIVIYLFSDLIVSFFVLNDFFKVEYFIGDVFYKVGFLKGCIFNIIVNLR